MDTLPITEKDLGRRSLSIGELLGFRKLGLHSLNEIGHALQLKSAVDEFFVLYAWLETLSIVSHAEIFGKETVHGNDLAVERALCLLIENKLGSESNEQVNRIFFTA